MWGQKRILVVGNGGAGKDTACLHLAAVTRLRFVGTTSLFLASRVAMRLGVSPEEAYRSRHRDRNLWHRLGNEARRSDPAVLAREALAEADITGGVRGMEELAACRREGLADLVVWVANEKAPRDSTIGFGERDCDVTIPNHWTLAEFHARLTRLARFAGLPMRD